MRGLEDNGSANGGLGLFTLAGFTSLQTSAAAALMVPNAIHMVYPLSNRARLVIALLVSEICSFLSAIYAGASGWAWLVAVLNGFVIFTASVGLNEGAAELTDNGGGVMKGDDSKRKGGRFFQSWL